MVKVHTVILMACIATAAAHAEQISQSQAAAVAAKYMRLAPAAITATPDAPEAAYYAFNAPGGGFIVVSGDDRLTEVVGYSHTGSFQTDGMPDNLRAYLDSYTAYVESVQAGEVSYSKSPVTIAATATVEPLVATTWNQGDPYNLQCPSDNSGLCYTGCVATAMAQLMNYWEWPATGKGSNTYTPSSAIGSLTVDFTQSAYDWANMLDSYSNGYTTDEANAVAKLMYDCGVSVDMQYTSSSSGAYSSDVPFALAEHFGYNTQFYYRDAYTNAAFLNIIKTEIDAERPLLFSGQGTAGGHAFVADGYDSNDFIHINWGWGGRSDGYFDIDAMNPSALGTGGGAGGFVDSQSVIAMQPDYTMAGSHGNHALRTHSDYFVLTPALSSDGSVELTVSGYWNACSCAAFTGYLSAGIFDTDMNLVASPEYDYTISSFPSWRIVNQELSLRFPLSTLSALPDGTYLLWPTSKDTSDSSADLGYIPVAMENGYCPITIDNGEISFEAKNLDLHETKAMTMDAEYVNIGDNITVALGMKNNSAFRLYGDLYLSIVRVDDETAVWSGYLSDRSLREGEEIELNVSMTLPSVLENLVTYKLVLSQFVTSTASYAISSTYDPLTFTPGVTAGIGSTEAPGKIKVYPNPTTGIVSVGAEAAIEAYSLSGGLVKSAEGTSIDLTGCPAGVYLLKVSAGGASTVHRVVKK